MSKKITIEVSDTIAAQLDEVVRATRVGEHEALAEERAVYAALPEAVRSSRPTPKLMTDDEIIAQVLATGATETLHEGIYPNSYLVLGEQLQPRKAGDVLRLEAHLPLGTRLLAMTTSAKDGPHWNVAVLGFGSLLTIDNNSTPGTTLPLTDLLYVSSRGLLSPFHKKKTAFDVQVHAKLVCKTDGATFDGLRLHIKKEDQICAIAERLVPVQDDGLVSYKMHLQASDAAQGVAKLQAAMEVHRSRKIVVAKIAGSQAVISIEIRLRSHGEGLARVKEKVLLDLFAVASSINGTLEPNYDDPFAPSPH
jgi:hypothetical protein